MDGMENIIAGFKRKMVEAKVVPGFFYMLTLVVLQAAFIVFSLPVFVFLPGSSYKKYFKNATKAAESYQLRRLIILATTGGIVILLVLRVFIGIVANASSGSINSHPGADDLLNLKNGKAVSDQNTAVIQKVDYKNFGNDVVFTGTAPANSRILLFIDAGGELVYKTMADANGLWKITHSQKNVNMPPGSHTAQALAYSDSDPGTYSYSNIFSFNFDFNRWPVFAGIFNPGIIVLFLGAVLVLLMTHLKLRKA
jgi:hypothetical protein